MSVDPQWKKRLLPVMDDAVSYLANLIIADKITDRLVSKGIITLDHHESLRVRQRSGATSKDVARDLVYILCRTASPKFERFCTILEEIDGGDDLYGLLTDPSLLKQPSVSETQGASNRLRNCIEVEDRGSTSSTPYEPTQPRMPEANVTKPDRTVIFIGETGAGKSTCGNAIAGEWLFEASESSASATKDVLARTATLEWEGNPYRIKIVDTIGIGDTDILHEEVLTRLAVACHECQEGINAVFFVVRKRFTKAQADAFDVFWQIIFGPEVLKYTTVVRTHFRSFRDPTAVENDRSKWRKQEGSAKRILSHVGDRILYVDNNEDKPDSLRESRSLMLRHLVLKCKDVFRPPAQRNVRTHQRTECACM